MQCKCGAELKYAIHDVKTQLGLNKWCEDITISERGATIEQLECPSCGRLQYKVWNDSTLIKDFG